MATYLHLARYTPEGMKGALAEGMTARRAMYEKVINASGGTLHSYDMVADGDWDLAIVNEFPDTMDHAVAARMSAAFRAGGALEAIRTFRLASPEAFDAASRTTERTYGPPSTS